MDLSARRARLAGADPAELGATLKAARVAGGLTQGAVAQGHLSIGYLSRIESGQRRPGLALLEVVVARLDLDLDELLTPPELAPVVPQPILDFAEIAVSLGDAESALGHLHTLDPTGLTDADRWRLDMVRAQACEATGDLNGAIETLERLQSRDTDELSRMTLGMSLSRCYRDHGEYANAIRAGETALQGADRLGLQACDESVQLTVTVAAAYFEQGDRELAIRMCRRAVATAEELGSVKARASAYWNASVMTMEQGRVAEAVPLARRALALLESGSDDRNLCTLRAEVGHMELLLDPPDVVGAREHLEAGPRRDADESRLAHRHAAVAAGPRALRPAGRPARLRRTRRRGPAGRGRGHLPPHRVRRAAAGRAGRRRTRSTPKSRAVTCSRPRIVWSQRGTTGARPSGGWTWARSWNRSTRWSAAKDAYRASAVASGVRPSLMPAPRGHGNCSDGPSACSVDHV